MNWHQNEVDATQVAQAPPPAPSPWIYASGITVPAHPMVPLLPNDPIQRGPTEEEIGNRMITLVDRTPAKALGEIVFKINSMLVGIGQQPMSRDGWEKYDKLVSLFEEITGYEEG